MGYLWFFNGKVSVGRPPTGLKGQARTIPVTESQQPGTYVIGPGKTGHVGTTTEIQFIA